MAAFSNASSAYSRFSVAFSASSSFSRLSSARLVPAYFDRQLKYVARLIPCLRTRSAIGIPVLVFLHDANDLTLREPGLLHGDSFQSARESKHSMVRHQGKRTVGIRVFRSAASVFHSAEIPTLVFFKPVCTQIGTLPRPIQLGSRNELGSPSMQQMAADTRNGGATTTARRRVLVAGALVVSLALLWPWGELRWSPSWGNDYDWDLLQPSSTRRVPRLDRDGRVSRDEPSRLVTAFPGNAASTVAVRHGTARAVLAPPPRLPPLPGGDPRNLPGVRSTHVGRDVPGFVPASGPAAPTRDAGHGRPVRGDGCRRVRPDPIPGRELDGFHPSRRPACCFGVSRS